MNELEEGKIYIISWSGDFDKRKLLVKEAVSFPTLRTSPHSDSGAYIAEVVEYDE